MGNQEESHGNTRAMIGMKSLAVHPACQHTEDSDQERQRSAKEVEELQSRLSQTAAAAWQHAARSRLKWPGICPR